MDEIIIPAGDGNTERIGSFTQLPVEGQRFWVSQPASKYIRVAVTIQGAFDRSECLAPHPRVCSWTAEGSCEAIRLAYDGERLVHEIVVPFEKLFNVSAYRLGDCLMFFRAPRTREHYLERAPMLIAAEEYHRGTSKAQAPGYRNPDHEY